MCTYFVGLLLECLKLNVCQNIIGWLGRFFFFWYFLKIKQHLIGYSGGLLKVGGAMTNCLALKLLMLVLYIFVYIKQDHRLVFMFTIIVAF